MEVILLAKYLCKKCNECKVYRYEREYHNKPFKFLYCEGNKDLVESFNWFPETHTKGHTSYVRCTDPKRFGHNRLHTYFSEEGYVIDHINRNGLDNRLRNLRLITKRENSLNRTDNTDYVGVYPEGDGWIARIKLNGKYHRLGRWDYDPNNPKSVRKAKEQAKLAYLKARQTYTGVKV